MRGAIIPALASMGAALFAPGCSNATASVRQRATFDLGCEVRDSDVQVIGNYQWGVTACGCRASYVGNAAGQLALNAASGEGCTVASAGGESE